MDDTSGWEKFYTRVVEEIGKGARRMLEQFGVSLGDWLYAMLNWPTDDWRDQLYLFVEHTRHYGLEIHPESIKAIRNLVEARVHGTGPFAVVGPYGATQSGEHASIQLAMGVAVDGGTRTDATLALDSGAPLQLAMAMPVGISATKAHTQKDDRELFFNQKLAQAQKHLDEIEPVLRALGQRLDAARDEEPLDVEAEVKTIETLIWHYNDALESARAAWLQHDLGGGTYNRLASLTTPAAFNLPLYTDEQQAERAKRQEKQIGQRLGQRTATFDRIILGMKAAEMAGTAASLLLGAGVVITAVKTGGKWAVVKTVAKMAGAAGAAIAAGKATEHGLRAAGASEETIHGVILAAEVVTWLLLLRRVRAAGTKAPPRSAPQPPAPRAKAPSSPRPVEPRAPCGPLKNPSGNLDEAASAARTQPHATAPARATQKKPRLPRRGTPERGAIEQARRQGVNAKKANELANIRAGGRGSGVWTEAELQQIRETGKFPADVRWHHDPTVANRPELAADPSVVRPVRGGTQGHLDAHGGDFRKPSD